MIGGIQPFDLLLSLYKYVSRGVIAVVFFSSLCIRSLPLLLILSCLSAVVRLTKKKGNNSKCFYHLFFDKCPFTLYVRAENLAFTILG